MAIKYTCDECGKEGAGRASFHISTSAPHKIDAPQFDGELCAACLARVLGVLKSIWPKKS